jgi:hypothetical protein
MFLPPGNSTKDNLLYKQIELYSALAFALIPILFLLKDGYYLSSSLISSNKIAGVVNSPYFTSSKVDLNDGQLKGFLEGLPLLTVVGITFVLLRRLLVSITSNIQASLIYYLVLAFTSTGQAWSLSC